MNRQETVQKIFDRQKWVGNSSISKNDIVVSRNLTKDDLNSLILNLIKLNKINCPLFQLIQRNLLRTSIHFFLLVYL